MYCPRVKIIDHADPLFIVGADVLRAGRAPHVWDWRSIGAEPGAGGRGVQGYLMFSKGGSQENVPLICAPAAGKPREYKRPPA